MMIWRAVPRNSVYRYESFRGIWCLHRQGIKSEDGNEIGTGF